MKWKTPKAGPLRLSLSAMQVGNICGIDFMAHGPQVCHCEEAVGRRGNFGKALPIGTDHHQNATRQLRLPMALIERPVQGHSTEGEHWCTTAGEHGGENGMLLLPL